MFQNQNLLTTIGKNNKLKKLMVKLIKHIYYKFKSFFFSFISQSTELVDILNTLYPNIVINN